MDPSVRLCLASCHYPRPFNVHGHTYNKKPEPALGSLLCVDYEPSGLVHEKNEADNDHICSELTFARYHASIIPAHV